MMIERFSSSELLRELSGQYSFIVVFYFLHRLEGLWTIQSPTRVFEISIKMVKVRRYR